MNKQFVPYAESLELKELGFDDDCFTHFFDGEWEGIFEVETFPNRNTGFRYPKNQVSAPLWQQAFDWFRTEHGLFYSIMPEFYTTGINFNWQLRWYLPKSEWTKYIVSDGTMWYGDNGEYPTQRDAELATLRKMITITLAK